MALQTAEIQPFETIEKLDCFNFLHVGIYPHINELDYKIHTKIVVSFKKIYKKKWIHNTLSKHKSNIYNFTNTCIRDLETCLKNNCK